MTPLRSLLLTLVTLTLTACVALTKVGPGPVTVKDMSFTLDGPWNRFESGMVVLFQAPGASEIWTREGFSLDVLAFYAGVADGETLGQSLPRSQTKLPPFKSTMAPHEIVELFETLVTQDASTFKLGRLEPVAFGGGDGFRFEYTLRRKEDSLVFNGVGYGSVAGKRLYLMTFSAPRAHYFGKLLPDVEAVARSARVKR